MADVKWIKITTDMFDNRKVKHLRRLPDGNNIVLIWVMLLTMAGRCNANGMIFLTENIPYTSKMLADELDFEENTVQLALNALEQLNMITRDGDMFTIAGWDCYQNIEGLDKIREQNRLRKQKQRQQQKALTSVSRDSHGTVTGSHATEREKEERIKKKDEEIKEKNKKENAYGLYSNVFLTLEEYETLQAEFPNDYVKRINSLSNYIESTGKEYKNHLATIRNWASKEQDKQTQQGQACSNPFLLLAMQEEE